MHSSGLNRRFRAASIFAILIASCYSLQSDEPQRPIDGIMDNSFLVEEAYNQEDGVVQHIFNLGYGFDKFSGAGARKFDFVFTQEWPAWGQAHQFSYTIPYTNLRADHKTTDGLGDVLLNYRYQAYFETNRLTALAPRFSLVLPTGDERFGLGSGNPGYQWNLPFSTTLNDRTFVHANAGVTFLPESGFVAKNDLLNYNLAASAIYCLSDTFNLMLEWTGNCNELSVAKNHTSHEFFSVISPGFRYALNFQGEKQLVLGLAAPIGLTRTAADIGVFFYLSFEHRLWGFGDGR